MKNKEIFVIAHNIRSLFNVGSIFRSADVFGVKKIFLTGYTAYPPRKEISKTALGSEQLIPWEYAKQPTRIIKKLQSQGVHVIALETKKGAIPLPNFTPRFPIALLLGNEVAGILPALLKSCNEIVQIPMLGKKESLNVAIAASITLYAIRCSNLL